MTSSLNRYILKINAIKKRGLIMLDKILDKILDFILPVERVEDDPPGTIIDRVIDPHTLPSLSDKERLRIKEDLKNHGLDIDLIFQKRLKKK